MNLVTNSEYLLFYIGEDIYAIEVQSINEIVEYTHITKVPNMQPFIKGVTNIRGDIVPVVDISQRVGLDAIVVDHKTSLIIVNYENKEGEAQIGILVDEVYEVEKIALLDMHKVPDFGTKIDKFFLLNMSYYQGNYIAIFNLKTLLDIDELAKTTTMKG